MAPLHVVRQPTDKSLFRSKRACGAVVLEPAWKNIILPEAPTHNVMSRISPRRPRRARPFASGIELALPGEGVGVSGSSPRIFLFAFSGCKDQCFRNRRGGTYVVFNAREGSRAIHLMIANRTPSTRGSAFTLVELLVSIGIIAVIIAILLPALALSRRDAQQIKCAANLRNLGMFLMMHANEHGGYLPLAGNIVPGTDETGVDNPQTLGDVARQRYVYYDNGGGNYSVTALPAALAPYISSVPVRDDSWQNVDADIQAAGPLQDAFICPSDENTIDRSYLAPRWINNYGGGTFLNGWSSYGINAEVFGWTDSGVGGTTGHSRARGKLSTVPRPSETMLMCDTYAAIEIWVLGPQLSLGNVYLGTGGTAGNGVFDLSRHRGSVNILYVDGHVDRQLILSTGAVTPSGAVGSPHNSPSGDLMGVSMDKDFP
jgi:prepilin-type processing-associated H-X9-DG protein